ncbi:hypothetical protein [Cellulomonas sp. URHB0016]
MSARDAVALVLATTVGVAWVVAVVAAVTNPGSLTFKGSVVLYGLGGTLVGAVVGWLARSTRKDEER